MVQPPGLGRGVQDADEVGHGRRGTQVRTAEKGLRQQPDTLARWVLILEGGDAPILESVGLDFLSADALARRGAAPDPLLAIYRLQYLLAK